MICLLRAYKILHAFKFFILPCSLIRVSFDKLQDYHNSKAFLLIRCFKSDRRRNFETTDEQSLRRTLEEKDTQEKKKRKVSRLRLGLVIHFYVRIRAIGKRREGRDASRDKTFPCHSRKRLLINDESVPLTPMPRKFNP